MDFENQYLDISLPLGRFAAAFPGDPAFQADLFADHPDSGFRGTRLAMSAHAGAHLDFPGHVIPDGGMIQDFGMDRFFLPALVVDAGDESPVTARAFDDISTQDPPHGGAVLIRTANSRRYARGDFEFHRDFTALAPDAAKWLANSGATCAGIDAMSVDPLDAEDLPAHKILLGAGLLILEGLDLSGAAPGRWILACAPLALPRAEASPVRAALLGPGAMRGLAERTWNASER